MDEPDRYAHTPTEPADCSAEVVSVAWSCQVPGSAVPSFHTFAARPVVPVPVTWNRTRSTSPAFTVSPGTVATVCTAVSVPPTTRISCAVTAPPAWTRSFIR